MRQQNGSATEPFFVTCFRGAHGADTMKYRRFAPISLLVNG